MKKTIIAITLFLSACTTYHQEKSPLAQASTIAFLKGGAFANSVETYVNYKYPNLNLDKVSDAEFMRIGPMGMLGKMQARDAKIKEYAEQAMQKNVEYIKGLEKKDISLTYKKSLSEEICSFRDIKSRSRTLILFDITDNKTGKPYAQRIQDGIATAGIADMDYKSCKNEKQPIMSSVKFVPF